MDLVIKKRDDTIVPFDSSKIENAVLAAFNAVDGTITDYAKEKAKNIAQFIQRNAHQHIYSVEEIQDLVEKGLMATKRKDVAKAYILYRQKRTKARERKTQWYQDFHSKMTAENVENQNANVDEKTAGGRKGEANAVMQIKFALEEVISPKFAKNHLENRVYIHDLREYLAGLHNCLTIPFDDLLANGFITRQQDIRPAGSINSAMQLVAVIFQLQSLSQYGGCSSSHLDWTMVPYVRKSFNKHFYDGLRWIENKDIQKKDIDSNTPIDDKVYTEHPEVYAYAMEMTTREAHQAAEGMYHNLNSLQSRSGSQLPFTSINYGTCTLPEGRLIIKALLDELYKGGGPLHKTYIFPCSIFQIGNGINKYPKDPNYDLFQQALKCTAKRLYPNYANIDWSGNKGYDINRPETYFSTMGCRTCNGFDINGLGQQKDGRGNIHPATIILPTIAMEAKIEAEERHKDILQVFFEHLNDALIDCRDELIERFEYSCKQSPSLAPFMWQNKLMDGYIEEEGLRSALRHGTLSVGQIGLAECLQILIGVDHTTDKGMTLAKEIEELYYNKCKEWKEQYKLNFGVYMTPAENLCYTALKKFREKYGVIPKISDKEFFTNSMHVPVWKEISPFDKIDIESELTGYSTAG